jgi:hypothetical protein
VINTVLPVIFISIRSMPSVNFRRPGQRLAQLFQRK